MKKLKAVLVWYLVVAMFFIAITPKCFAAFSPSGVIALSQGERSQDLQKVQKFLETKMVRERLGEFGFTPEEIRLKLGGLSDPQIHQLALHLDEMKVTGDGGEIIIILLLIAILIVLIIYVSGHKVVVK
jgi:hypothetical protein